MCENCITCNPNTHFQARACRADLQTGCQGLTTCKADEFESTAKTMTSDRFCRVATKCVAGQEEASQLTATLDRSCRACPAGKTDADSNPTTPCVSCGAGHFVPQGSRGSCTSLRCGAGFTDGDSDATTACVACDGTTAYSPTPGRSGDCLAMKVCAAGQEVAVVGTSIRDRVCQDCASGAYSVAQNSVCAP